MTFLKTCFCTPPAVPATAHPVISRQVHRSRAVMLSFSEDGERNGSTRSQFYTDGRQALLPRGQVELSREGGACHRVAFNTLILAGMLATFGGLGTVTRMALESVLLDPKVEETSSGRFPPPSAPPPPCTSKPWTPCLKPDSCCPANTSCRSSPWQPDFRMCLPYQPPPASPPSPRPLPTMPPPLPDAPPPKSPLSPPLPPSPPSPTPRPPTPSASPLPPSPSPPLSPGPPPPPSSPRPCPTLPWQPCMGGKCCPAGYTCTARGPAFAQCAPRSKIGIAGLRRDRDESE